MKQLSFLFLSLFAGTLLCSDLLAQQILTDFSPAIHSARSSFRPLSESDAIAARSRLDWALYDLDFFLYASGESNRAAWKAFLHWNELQTELAKEKPDPTLLLDQARYLKENEKGLELGQFTKARAALEEYAILLQALSEDESDEAYQKALDQLSTDLPTFQLDRSVDNALKVASVVNWLERHRQAPGLVSGIRNQFNRPNVHIYLAGHLLGRTVNRPVNEPSAVNDCILGTRVLGQACLTGNLNLQLVPCSSHARLQVVLNGLVNSNTNGYQKSVRVHSTGVTSVHATKVLDLTPDALRGYPADAHCSTDTTIHDIHSSKLPRIIERAAWKRAGQQLPQAEAVASQKAETRIESRMNEESQDMIAKNNQRLREMKYPLIRKNLVPQLQFASTSSHLITYAWGSGFGQLGGFDSPAPAILGSDIVGQIHETAVVNYGEALIGGVTLTDAKVAQMVKERTGSIPEELQLSPDKDPWSLTFADEAPVRVRFEDNLVRLGIRSKSLTRSENRVNELIEISAAYKVQITPTGSVLNRVGDVDVEFVNRKGLGAQHIVVKTFLRRKFEALFKEELTSEGLPLKGEFAQGNKVQMKNVTFHNGWATAGFDLVPNTSHSVIYSSAAASALPGDYQSSSVVHSPSVVQQSPPSAPVELEETIENVPSLSSIPEIAVTPKMVNGS